MLAFAAELVGLFQLSGVSLKRTVQWKHVTLLERQPSSEPCSSPILLGTTGAVRLTCWAYLNLEGI